MSPRRASHRASRSDGGHSVLELIIAMAVLSVTLIVATEMLLERERQLARAARVANRMSAEQAIELLHRDLRVARATVGLATGAWEDGPLALVSGGGVVLTWWRERGALLRGRQDAGVAQGTRVMLDRVVGFRWRWSLASGTTLPLVAVEVRYETGSEIVGTGRVGTERVDTAVRRTRVALRGAGAQAW